MLKFKYKYLKILYISLILLVLFINSCVYDSGWIYKVIDPYHENTYHREYTYRSYPLNIELSAHDFALETYVFLQITTPFDSIEIYPTQAYIKSPHFIETTHPPIYANIETLPKDSIYAEQYKKVNKKKFSGPYFLSKEDKLLVKLKFEGFAKYDKRNRNYPFTSEKSDFIFYYDIFNKENPLTFHFKPSADTTKGQ